MKIKYSVSVIAVSLLVLSTTPAVAADDSNSKQSSTTAATKNMKKTKHCELQDIAKKCCETEKSGINYIDELIKVVEDAKASKKKKVKDRALDNTLSVLQKLKVNSEATVCAMETIQKRNKVLKGKVEKIKKELGVVESMFNTSVSEPFMSGPYF